MSTLLSSFLLLVNGLLIVTDLILPGLPTVWPSAVAVGLFFVLQWPKTARLGRVFLLALGLAVMGTAGLGQLDLELLAAGFERAAFFVFFLTAIMVLREAAETSRLLERCGEVLIQQPPGRRFMVLAFGQSIFGMFLSFGTVSIFANMARQALERQRPEHPTIDDRRIEAIRTARIGTAILRGFTTMPLWVPTSMTIAVFLLGFPELSWFGIAPWGLLVATALILLGWTFDYVRYPRVFVSVPGEPGASPLTPILGLFLIAACIPVLGLGLSLGTNAPMAYGVMVAMPIVGLAWTWMQYLNDGQGRVGPRLATRWRYRTLDRLPEIRTEAALMAGSGVIAVLVAALIDADAVSQFLIAHDVPSAAILLGVAWAVLIAGFIGINPMVGLLLIVEVLPDLHGIDIDPVFLFLVTTTVFGTLAAVAPISITVLMVANELRTPPATVGLRWNGKFAACVMGLLSVIILLYG